MVGGDGDELVLFDDVGREVLAVDAACVQTLPLSSHREALSANPAHYQDSYAVDG